jgi:hypothetical protein
MARSDDQKIKFRAAIVVPRQRRPGRGADGYQRLQSMTFNKETALVWGHQSRVLGFATAGGECGDIKQTR